VVHEKHCIPSPILIFKEKERMRSSKLTFEKETFIPKPKKYISPKIYFFNSPKKTNTKNLYFS